MTISVPGSLISRRSHCVFDGGVFFGRLRGPLARRRRRAGLLGEGGVEGAEAEEGAGEERDHQAEGRDLAEGGRGGADVEAQGARVSVDGGATWRARISSTAPSEKSCRGRRG